MGEVALGTLTPFALVIPVVKTLSVDKNPCLEALNPSLPKEPKAIPANR